MQCVFPEPVFPTTPVAAIPIAQVPRVLCDLSTPPFDTAAVRRAAEILTTTCDAVLVGDHQDRPDFPPTMFARLLRESGLVPWITLACRDRNRVVLEQEVRGLRQAGAAAVLCVTGDGRAYDVRPGVTQVFDLDGTRLTALAAAAGLPVAVPETPTAPPVESRPRRLVGKQLAGAAVCVLNHVPQVAGVERFVAAARAAGLSIPVIAAAAVYTDPTSAAALQALPGLELDADAVRAVVSARDPVEAGIAACVAQALALLEIDGVAGVNVSGSASARGWEHAAQVKAEVGRRILAAV